MKKFLLAAAVAIAVTQTTTVCAQNKWSAGYRSGFEIIDYNLNQSDFSTSNMVWMNEAYVTKKLGRRFELEAGLRLGSKSNSGSRAFFDARERGTTYYDHTLTHMTFSLVGRFYFFRKGNLNLYGQLGTSMLQTFDKLNRTYTQTGAPDRITDEKSNGSLELLTAVSPGIGGNHAISKTLYLSMNFIASYKVDGSDMNNTFWSASVPYNNNDWAAQLLVGVGVRF